MKNFLDKHAWFLIILLVGVFLRLLFIGNQGFMNDELSAWFRLDYTSFSDLIEYGVKVGDMHPAFYQVLLYYWSKLLGESDFVLRIPALLFFIASAFIIYKIANKYFTKTAGLIALIYLSLLVFPIIDTSLTRPYTSGIFFSLLFVQHLFKLFESQKREWLTYFLMVVGIVGAMYSHYFAFFTVGCFGLLALFFVQKKQIVALISVGIVSLLLFLPHWSITEFQLSRGGLEWLGTPDREWFFRFIRLFLNHSEIIIIATFVLPLIAFFFNKEKSPQRKFTTFAAYSFFLVLIGGYIISYTYTPILREKGLLFSIPLLLLALGNLYVRFKEHHRFFLLLILVVGFTTHTLFFGNLLKPIHYGVFKEVAADTKNYNTAFGKENIDYFGNFVHPDYFNHYYKPTNDSIDFLTTRLWDDGDYTEKMMFVYNSTKNSKKDIIGILYSNMTMVPMVYELIRLHYPAVKKHILYFNSGSFLFDKKKVKRSYVDSISPSISPELYNNWNEELNNQQYIGDLKIKVLDLRAIQEKKSNYFLIKGKGVKQNSTFRVIVTAERNGEVIKRNEEELNLYQNFDMDLLYPNDTLIEYFLPFELPDDLKGNDIVKIFVENSSKKKITVEKPKVYVVNPSK